MKQTFLAHIIKGTEKIFEEQLLEKVKGIKKGDLITPELYKFNAISDKSLYQLSLAKAIYIPLFSLYIHQNNYDKIEIGKIKKSINDIDFARLQYSYSNITGRKIKNIKVKISSNKEHGIKIVLGKLKEAIEKRFKQLSKQTVSVVSQKDDKTTDIIIFISKSNIIIGAKINLKITQRSKYFIEDFSITHLLADNTTYLANIEKNDDILIPFSHNGLIIKSILNNYEFNKIITFDTNKMAENISKKNIKNLANINKVFFLQINDINKFQKKDIFSKIIIDLTSDKFSIDSKKQHYDIFKFMMNNSSKNTVFIILSTSKKSFNYAISKFGNLKKQKTYLINEQNRFIHLYKCIRLS